MVLKGFIFFNVRMSDKMSAIMDANRSDTGQNYGGSLLGFLFVDPVPDS